MERKFESIVQPVPYTFRFLPSRSAERCIGCCACVERCPGNATGADDESDLRMLFVECHKCLRCGRCADVCPEQALSLMAGPSAEELTIKATTGDQTTCRSDGKEVDHDALFEEMKATGMTHHPGGTDDASFTLQRCTVCGDIMPVTEKQIGRILRRVQEQQSGEEPVEAREFLLRYVYSCVSCRQRYSRIWGTQPVSRI